MKNKYRKEDINEAEARKRMEAKQLIEQRLQQIQKEYNQRVLTGGGAINNNTQNKASNL